MNWLKNNWPMLLQPSYTGKTCTALSIEDSADYNLVKSAILKNYERVPKAYHQKFRNYRKIDAQMCQVFTRKNTYFDRWNAMRNIKTNYKNFKQIVLIKEFKNCIPEDIKTHINESKVEIT